MRDDLKARWIYDAGTYTGKGTSDRVVETDLFDDIAFLIIWPRSEDIDGSYTYSYPFYAEYISSSETTYYQNTCFSYSNKGATIEGDPYVTILPGGVFVVHPEVEAYHSADRNRTIGCVNQKSHTYQWIAFGIGPYSLEEGEW